jgi:hypothetical protein
MALHQRNVRHGPTSLGIAGPGKIAFVLRIERPQSVSDIGLVETDPVFHPASQSRVEQERADPLRRRGCQQPFVGRRYISQGVRMDTGMRIRARDQNTRPATLRATLHSARFCAGRDAGKRVVLRKRHDERGEPVVRREVGAEQIQRAQIRAVEQPRNGIDKQSITAGGEIVVPAIGKTREAMPLRIGSIRRGIMSGEPARRGGGAVRHISDRVSELAAAGDDPAPLGFGPGHLDDEAPLAGVKIRNVVLRSSWPYHRPCGDTFSKDAVASRAAYLAVAQEGL